MADERGVHAMPAEIFLFKGQNARNLIDPFAELSHPPLAPRPKLRRDVIEHGNAALVGNLRKMEVHGRRIDADLQIRLILVEIISCPAEELPHFARSRGRLIVHRRTLGCLVMDEHAGLGHLWAAVAFDDQMRIELAQMLGEMAGMLIAADFRDGDENTPTHCLQISLHPAKVVVSSFAGRQAAWAWNLPITVA